MQKNHMITFCEVHKQAILTYANRNQKIIAGNERYTMTGKDVKELSRTNKMFYIFFEQVGGLWSYTIIKAFKLNFF